MKIVFLHMHLKPGGVSTVISQQVAALDGLCEVLVASGDDPPPDFPAPHIRIPGLGYDHPEFPENDPEPVETANALQSAIQKRWPGGCDIIHVHNPLLAKNSRLLSILAILQARGFILFLQIHDFPEDGRPGFYYRNRDYLPDCHYGTINARDARILIQSGLRPEGVHELFNMVHTISSGGLEGSAIPTVLYPVRGIRRKNLGEAILLSLWFAANTPLAITLPPNSEADQVVYDCWRRYVLDKRLNVLFEASGMHDFEALVADARFLLTTSINEGFGFAFLEPWGSGKALMGRRLPDICQDFEGRGIQLDHLYDQLHVPVDWIDLPAFEDVWKHCIRMTYERYGSRIEEEKIRTGFMRLTQDAVIDFSLLSESFQRGVIDRIIADPYEKDSFQRINPMLARFADLPDYSRVIESNREAVLRQYDMAIYRRRLMEVYSKVLSVKVVHAIDKTKLLNRFLQPDHFSLIKWCDIDPC